MFQVDKQVVNVCYSSRDTSYGSNRRREFGSGFARMSENEA